jgi:S-DNA-T family DNA segregation ATPase FtsK/SpoIIIE
MLSDFNVHYNNGMILEGGGAVSMMLGGIIVKLVGLPGLYILSIVVLMICLLLLMDTPVSRCLEAAKERKERRKTDREERLREKEREREKQQRQMEIEMLAAGYSKQEIENVKPVLPERSNISASQKKILGYMNDEGRVFGSGESTESEALDFSLGENKEKESRRRGRRKAVKPEEIIETPVTTEAEQFVKEPIIVGGFSPKQQKRSLLKQRLRKLSLRKKTSMLLLIQEKHTSSLQLTY